MAITDIFKKEDGAKDGAAAQNKEKKAAAQKSGAPKVSRKAGGQAGLFLKQARVTEKASNLAEMNQYVFDVSLTANKKDITRAVEGYYGVEVIGVNVINVPGKRRRRAKGITIEPGYRKAIVSVKKGQSIEVMPK